MSNPATVDDLEARWRPLSTQEQTNGETFLDDAWSLLTRRIGTLDADAAADSSLRTEVIRVIATAVLRVMKNPDGKRTESIDDYAWTRDQAVSAGLLYFTGDEWAALMPGSSGGAFSITAAGSPYVARTYRPMDSGGWYW